MRTTISLDDRVFEAVKRRAAQEGKSVSGYISTILDEAVKKHRHEEAPPFELIAVGDGGPYPGIDLDKPRELMVAEDEQKYGD